MQRFLIAAVIGLLFGGGAAAQSPGSFSTLTTTGTATLNGDVLMCSGRPWIDVKCPGLAGGAVGDGSHDDTGALQTAINTAITNNWPVHVPAGTYRVTARLTIDYAGQASNGFRLISEGATIDGRSIASGPVLQIQCSGGTPSSPANCFYFKEEGALFVNANTPAYGVVIGKSELLSYQTATLVAPYRYDLTYLRRGIYGTAIGAHGSSANFARFGPNDPSLFRYRYPKSFIGQTIHVKLPAFNIFGQELQGLAGLSAASYGLTGAGLQPQNIHFSYLGVPTTSQANVPISAAATPTAGTPITDFTFSGDATFAAGLTGSICSAATVATADTIFDIAKNGTNWATMTFAASAASAGFDAASPQSCFVGDVLTVTPRTTDATLAGLTGFLAAAGPTVNSGSPQAGQPIVRYVFDDKGTLPAGFAGSRASAGTAAATTAIFDIALNGGNFGTMTFFSGSTAGFASSAPQNFVAGDVLMITPQSSDPQLADISGYLAVA